MVAVKFLAACLGSMLLVGAGGALFMWQPVAFLAVAATIAIMARRRDSA